MKNTQRIGTVLLTAGSLIVLCVVLVWLIAPLSGPPAAVTTAVSDSSASPFLAPALSPYSAPLPREVIENQANELDNPERSVHGIELDILNGLPSSSNWNVLPYSEAKAVGAHDRALAESSLRLSIPALGIDAPVIPVGMEARQSAGSRSYQQWTVPNTYAVGWHDSSAAPGQIGNTVLNGHNNVHGAVFSNLVDLTLGEQIILYEAGHEIVYHVVHRVFLPEEGVPLRTRLWNARWIAPSDDKRLTIVTCWPNTGNSHRLVVIAQPLTPETGF